MKNFQLILPKLKLSHSIDFLSVSLHFSDPSSNEQLLKGNNREMKIFNFEFVVAINSRFKVLSHFALHHPTTLDCESIRINYGKYFNQGIRIKNILHSHTHIQHSLNNVAIKMKFFPKLRWKNAQCEIEKMWMSLLSIPVRLDIITHNDYSQKLSRKYSFFGLLNLLNNKNLCSTKRL